MFEYFYFTDENVFNNQLVDLVSKRGGASPSYLMLAIDRISAEGNFDHLSSQIKSLGSTTIEMLGDVLKETLKSLIIEASVDF